MATKIKKRYKWPVWVVTHNRSRTPWGYHRGDPDNPKRLIPIPEQLDALEHAKDLMEQGRSTREASTWLSEFTGRYLSHAGLNRRFKSDNKLWNEFPRDEVDEEVFEISSVESKGFAQPRDAIKREGGRRPYKEQRKDFRGRAKDRRTHELKHRRAQTLKALTRIENELKADAKEDEKTLKLLPKDMQKELRKEVEKAEQDENTEVIKANPGPQEEFLAATETEVFYGGARGGGKRVDVELPVYTAEGPKKLREVQDGDTILTPCGDTTVVTKAHDIVKSQVYLMTFSNGQEVKACEDHLWYGGWRHDKRNFYKSWDDPYCVKDTKQIWEHYHQSTSKKLKRFSIPLTEPAGFTKKVLPIDPYIVGALLGDGCLTYSERVKQTCHVKDLPFFKGEYQKAGYVELSTVFVKGNCHDLFILGQTRKQIIKDLTSLGLMKTNSSTKFIPEDYLYSSTSDRFALLQGLMDTDGCVEPTKNGRKPRAKFYTVSNQLAKDVRHLASSLGFHVSSILKPAREKIEKDGTIYECQPCWQLEIKGPNQRELFRLPRKRELCSNELGTWNPGVTLDSIELLPEKAEMRCLTVDHPSRLFLIGDTFLPTHNTYSLLLDPIRYFGMKNFRGLLVRRTMPELRDIIYKTKELYPKAYPGAKFKVQENTWHFPSGARLEFGYAETIDDAERYRGQSYSWIGIDELPQYPDDGVYNLLKSSLRSADSSIPIQLRSTGNPGNVGSSWVKRKFIDPAPSSTRFHEEVRIRNPITGEEKVNRISMKYIPARIWDNPHLLQTDEYINALASLPEHMRKQMLEGDWDVVEDGAFPEFNRDHHVIKPFKIPATWRKIRAADWGYRSPFCCLWMAVDWDQNVYIYREWYDKEVYDEDWAKEIARIEVEAGEYMDTCVIDGSTDSNRGDTAKSIFDTINLTLKKYGVRPFRKADRSPGSRAAGKQVWHRHLALKETGQKDEEGKPIMKPSVFIFDTCTNLIRTLPALPVDPNDPDIVAKKGAEDHAYDAGQYGLRAKGRGLRAKFTGSSGTAPTVLDETFGY